MNTNKHNPSSIPQSALKTSDEDSNQKLIDACDYLTTAASCQDCTGLIPSAPASSSELESYEELYHFLPPAGKTDSIAEKSSIASDHADSACPEDKQS